MEDPSDDVGGGAVARPQRRCINERWRVGGLAAARPREIGSPFHAFGHHVGVEGPNMTCGILLATAQGIN